MKGGEWGVSGGFEVEAVGGGEKDGDVLAVGCKGDEAEVMGVEGGGGGAGDAVLGAIAGGGGSGEGVEAVEGVDGGAVDATQRLGDE